jgi:hypothetical protein
VYKQIKLQELSRIFLELIKELVAGLVEWTLFLKTRSERK